MYESSALFFLRKPLQSAAARQLAAFHWGSRDACFAWPLFSMQVLTMNAAFSAGVLQEKLIRRAVITLLPRLAAFAPERFAQDYLSKCIGHLLSVLKHTSERGAAFR